MTCLGTAVGYEGTSWPNNLVNGAMKIRNVFETKAAYDANHWGTKRPNPALAGSFNYASTSSLAKLGRGVGAVSVRRAIRGKTQKKT
jgi:hypothetical protein